MKHKVGIICGSTANRSKLALPLAECTIEAPFHITYTTTDGQTKDAFLDEPVVSAEDRATFIANLRNNNVLVGTAQPNTGEYNQLQAELIERYQPTETVVIGPGGKFSGAINAASSSCIEISQKYGIPSQAVDSQAISMAEGLIVMEAEDMALNGANSQQIIETIPKTLSRIHLIQVFTSLDQLRKNGRIGKANHLLAKVLGINALITLKDGELDAVSKVRGWNRTNQTALEYLTQSIGEKAVSLAILHYELEADIEQTVIDLARTALGTHIIGEPLIAEQSFVLSAHSDTNTYAYFAQDTKTS